MFSSVFSVALCGLEGTVIRVEADVRNGLPTFSMVGYLSTQVREAEERVRSAMANSGFSQEPKRITVNFSPADIRKEGTSYDLAVAVAVLSARLSLSEEKLQSSVFIGELSLSGELCPVAGILPKVLCAREAGFPQVFLAAANAHEAAICSGIRVLPFHDLSQVISYLADSDHLMKLPSTGGENGVRVIIGPENLAEELRDSSVVMASYDAGEGQRGLIGVVGPLRMDYSAVAAKLQYIAEGLSRLLGGGEAPAGFGKMILKGDAKTDE